MAICIVQLGTARNPDEGLRIGTVRRPPRGMRKEDYSKLDYYDVCMPELAPSVKLVSWVLSEPFIPKPGLYSSAATGKSAPAGPARVITLLAGLSSQTNLSVGCYCKDEARCHRSALRQLLLKQGAKLA